MMLEGGGAEAVADQSPEEAVEAGRNAVGYVMVARWG